jgi:osmoprotectant transport system substrate-binding protein
MTLRISSIVLCLLLAGCSTPRRDAIVIGSKDFTEQVVLSELLAQHIESTTGLKVDRRFYLRGSYIAHQALLAGRIDLYVEYTGTALTAVLKQPVLNDPRAAFDRVRSSYAAQFNLEVFPSLGFENTFAMVIRGEDARRLNLHTLSEAALRSRNWRAGVGYEFLERPDGYPGLVRAYGLRFVSPPRIMDLGLLYRALQEKQVDLVAGNSTDGAITALDLFVLADDRRYFPPYEAVPIVRRATLDKFPALRPTLEKLAGTITDADMRRMNYAVDGAHRDVAEVVREFLHRQR